MVITFIDHRHHEKKEEGKKGEKGHKFNEEGRFHKGHSIKGKHVVHKIDEGEKNTKFFDEDYDGGYEDGHGTFVEKHDAKKGGHHKKGHHHKSEHSGSGGKKGHGEKGHHDKEDKGRYSKMKCLNFRLHLNEISLFFDLFENVNLNEDLLSFHFRMES